MKKYLTGSNVLNFALFLQALIVFVADVYVFSEDVTKGISVALFCIGYFINTNKKKVGK